MSKSIYEETFNHLDELVDVLAHIEGSFLYRHYLDNIRLKLKQAQKQEKLLELHIDLGNKIEVLDNAYGYGIFEIDEIKNICKEIKELENE